MNGAPQPVLRTSAWAGLPAVVRTAVLFVLSTLTFSFLIAIVLHPVFWKIAEAFGAEEDRYRVVLFAALEIGMPLSWFVIVLRHRFRRAASPQPRLANRQAHSSECSVPKITFENVGGLEKQKEQIRAVVRNRLEPERYRRYGVVRNGILLHRPRGTGKRYVVTGAPGAGKTAVIRQLEIEGYGVVEEAATDVIAVCQAQGIVEPWKRPEFIDDIVQLQQIRERRGACAREVVQFHDRSVVCTAALAEYLGFPRSLTLKEELQRVKTEGVFQNKVLFLRNLGFITRTEARRITYEETVRFEQIHEQTYRNLGYEIIWIEPGSVANRVEQIKRTLLLSAPA